MAFHVLNPPQSQEEMAEIGKEILTFSHAHGEPMEVEGFLHAWISGMRVAVERDDSSNEIISLGIFSAGRRWDREATTASVLKCLGNKKQMLDFIRTLSLAIGASAIIYQEDEPLEMTEGKNRYIMVEEKIQ